MFIKVGVQLPLLSMLQVRGAGQSSLVSRTSWFWNLLAPNWCRDHHGKVDSWRIVLWPQFGAHFSQTLRRTAVLPRGRLHRRIHIGYQLLQNQWLFISEPKIVESSVSASELFLVRELPNVNCVGMGLRLGVDLDRTCWYPSRSTSLILKNPFGLLLLKAQVEGNEY